MKNVPKPKRTYDSTRRQEQARQTRQAIAHAALKLFMQFGYAGATVEAIAQEAGVALQTVYATFGTKRKILSHLLDISVGGDDQPVPVLQRPGPQTLFQESDQRRQLLMFARGVAEIMVRAAPVFEIMRVAAKTEPDIAELMQHVLQERWQNMGIVIQHISANGPLRDGLDQARAADIVWTLTSAEVVLLLTRDRDWATEQYIEWLGNSLIRLLLP